MIFISHSISRLKIIFKIVSKNARKTVKNHPYFDMMIWKEIKDNQLYLCMNGELIYKRWLNTGQSFVFDIRTFDKYTCLSITESKDDIHQRKEFCKKQIAV